MPGLVRVRIHKLGRSLHGASKQIMLLLAEAVRGFSVATKRSRSLYKTGSMEMCKYTPL